MKFIITGRYYNSTRHFHMETSSLFYAMGISLWNGSVWQVLDNGKRKLIKRVYN